MEGAAWMRISPRREQRRRGMLRRANLQQRGSQAWVSCLWRRKRRLGRQHSLGFQLPLIIDNRSAVIVAARGGERNEWSLTEDVGELVAQVNAEMGVAAYYGKLGGQAGSRRQRHGGIGKLVGLASGSVRIQRPFIAGR